MTGGVTVNVQASVQALVVVVRKSRSIAPSGRASSTCRVSRHQASVVAKPVVMMPVSVRDGYGGANAGFVASWTSGDAGSG